MNLILEERFINSLEIRLKNYGFIKNEVELKGSFHVVNFVLNLNQVNYNLLFRILPKRLKFEIYFDVEYTVLSQILKNIDIGSKCKYTFTGKLADFLEPENTNWFNNTTCLEDEKINLQNEEDINKTVSYIEEKYIKVVVSEIIPKINSLDKLNSLLNNYDLVYDEENDEPKMYVLSGGMIFQSVSALILNTIYNNPKKEKLIEMYSWLYNVLKDEEDIDKIIMGKTLNYVRLKTFFTQKAK